MKKSYENKSVIVTGGAMGIGRVTAMEYAKEGAKVCVADIAVSEGEETVRLIQELGGTAIFVPCDVSDAQQVENMINTTVRTFGKLDVAFNNAGIFEDEGLLEDAEEAVYDRLMDVNFKSIWYCMKYEIRAMKKNNGGVICNNSSIAGFIIESLAPVYTAGKCAVNGLTKAVAADYANSGIRINAVCGSAIKSSMMDGFLEAFPEMEEGFAAECPTPRIGETEEFAKAVLWLTSEKAPLCIGTCFAVDGGLMTTIGAPM